ncbi:hypothetical protein PMAYCL1PPCAC_08259, partial [Pristionchus mayeri]
AGGAISGASALFTDYELERQFLDSRCSIVLTDSKNLNKVLKALGKCSTVHTIICLNHGSSLSSSHLPFVIIDWT